MTLDQKKAAVLNARRLAATPGFEQAHHLPIQGVIGEVHGDELIPQAERDNCPPGSWYIGFTTAENGAECHQGEYFCVGPFADGSEAATMLGFYALIYRQVGMNIDFPD